MTQLFSSVHVLCLGGIIGRDVCWHLKVNQQAEGAYVIVALETCFVCYSIFLCLFFLS